MKTLLRLDTLHNIMKTYPLKKQANALRTPELSLSTLVNIKTGFKPSFHKLIEINRYIVTFNNLNFSKEFKIGYINEKADQCPIKMLHMSEVCVSYNKI